MFNPNLWVLTWYELAGNKWACMRKEIQGKGAAAIEQEALESKLILSKIQRFVNQRTYLRHYIKRDKMALYENALQSLDNALKKLHVNILSVSRMRYYLENYLIGYLAQIEFYEKSPFHERRAELLEFLRDYATGKYHQQSKAAA